MSRLLCVWVSLLLILTAGAAHTESWAVFTYDWVRVYFAADYSYRDYSLGGYGGANPIEYMTYESPDGFVLPSTWGRMVFTLQGDALFLSGGYLKTAGFSSAEVFEVLLSGDWAVCGSVTDSLWTPDPYAQFIATGFGYGHISWAPGTPLGYTTQLLLGYDFQGNDAATYAGYYPGDP